MTDETREVGPRCPPDEVLIHLAHGGFAGDVLAQLEAHLDGCSGCRLVVAAVAAGSAPADPRAVPELQPGARLGRYVVERLLGSGGMGVLYAARDTMLDRRVAVKLMRPHFADETGRARLLREAQAMAQLSHPNVVPVFDLGEVDERVFVAMELVEGGTLRDWLATPRSAEAIRDVFLQAGEGLLAAHRAGLVHRDFKPENVLVGADGRARVTDFGLARPGEGSDAPPRLLATGAVDLTQTGTVLGTPAYMSPEQLSLQPADARSDQYSFCVALFEALAGRRPYEGRTLAEVRALVLAGGVKRPSDERMTDAAWRVVDRGLRVDPSQRYPSMRELLDELRAPPQGPSAALVAGLAVALGVAAAVLVGVVTSSSEDAGEPTPARPLAPALVAQAPPVRPPATPIAGPATPDAAARAPDVLTELVDPERLPAAHAELAVVPGETRSFDVSGAASVHIGDASVADVSIADEVLTLEGRALGRTTLTLTGKGRTRTWAVVVRAPLAEPAKTLALFPGSEHVLEVPGLRRVSVGNASIADVAVYPRQRVLVSALAPGRTNLLAWTSDARLLEFVVTVSDDAPPLAPLLALEVGLQRSLSVPRLAGFSAGASGVCDAQRVGEHEVLLLPKRPGRGTLVTWTEDGRWDERTLVVKPPRRP
ncbi:MAG: protein kinase [Myxococcota bacterium]|jgi:serine/threonine-protein kinase